MSVGSLGVYYTLNCIPIVIFIELVIFVLKIIIILSHFQRPEYENMLSEF